MADDAWDTFSGACGLAGPFKVRLEVPGSSDPVPLEFRQPYLIVGTSPGADLSIDGVGVSRRHAYFQVVDGRVFCVDLGSRTGVRWSDGPRQVGWVDESRGVGIGPAWVRFDGQGVGQGGHLPISRAFEWPALPDVTLEFRKGGPGGEAWQVSRAMVLIGCSRACRIVLAGPDVAGIHAAIVRTPTGVWVVDLLGPGGVLVGGTPARSARLEDGDLIEIGDHRIRLRIGQAARPSGRSGLARRESSRAMHPAPGGDRTSPGPGGRQGVEIRSREDSTGPVDALTARLLDEFDRMHQRTTEQFQQAISMMFRMHQDQMGVIRDELSRLDRLEDEQRSLQAEMARGQSSRPPRVVLRLVAGGPAASMHSPHGAVPPRASIGANRDSLVVPDLVVRDRGEDNPPTEARQASGHHPSPSEPAPDPHARLSMRLAEIQDERQGLWKKLLGSLTGGESGRILP